MKFERYHKIALARYEALADGTEHFTLDQVIADAETEFRSLPPSEDMYHTLAATLVRSIDDKKAARLDDGQLDLLTGEPAALDSVWRLGGGRRVRARFANRTDALLWLGIRSANTDRVVAAFERDQRAVAELIAFMPDDSVSIGAAAEARKAALAEGDNA